MRSYVLTNKNYLDNQQAFTSRLRRSFSLTPEEAISISKKFYTDSIDSEKHLIIRSLPNYPDWLVVQTILGDPVLLPLGYEITKTLSEDIQRLVYRATEEKKYKVAQQLLEILQEH